MALGDLQWEVSQPAGGQLISDIDGWATDNNTALQTILKNYKKLTRIHNSSASEITITAPAEVVCTNGTIYKMRAITSNITCTASLGANKWYRVYAVADATATTFTGEIVEDGSSTSGTYTRLLTMFRTDGSSNIINFSHDGDEYSYSTWRVISSEGTYSLWTSVDTTTYVPSAISNIAVMSFGSTTNQYAALTNDSSVSSSQTVSAPNKLSVGSNQYNWAQATIKIITANTLYWGATNGSIYCAGFKVNKI